MASSHHSNIKAAEVVDLTRYLIGFDTVNPPGNEGPAMRALGEYLQDAGCHVQYLEVEPGRPNLVARIAGKHDSGHLVLSGHMDVVPFGQSQWQHPPLAAAQVDGRIIGRGAADMKGGVAAMAVALATLARNQTELQADVVLAVTMNEEAGMTGAQHLVDAGVLEGIGYLVVGEPTGLDVCVAQKNSVQWRVIVRGKTAHGARPHLGVNAITAMGPIVSALSREPLSHWRHDLLGPATVSVNAIHGGSAANVVPDLCEIVLDVRAIPGQNLDDLYGALRTVIEPAVRESGLPVTMELELLRPGSSIETDRKSPLISVALDALKSVTGREHPIAGFPGGTEAAVYAKRYDVPWIICGPAPFDQAHQPNEWVDEGELHQAAQAYVRLAEELLPT